MFNIDDTVYVKGVVTGVSKKDDGKFEYDINFKDTYFSKSRVTVDEDSVIKVPEI